MENPYPQPVDDGSWEDDGGFVAKPRHKMYAMEIGGGMSLNRWFKSSTETVLIMHPLTLAEYEHVLSKVK